MNVLVRAKRILFRMPRFVINLGETDEILGQLIGVYDNSPENDSLKVYETGISWRSKTEHHFFLFKEIENVELNDHDKMSDFIDITLKNRKLLKLPVRGKNNRCADICEFLRFLDRVKSDLLTNQ